MYLDELNAGETFDKWQNLTPVNLTTKGECGLLRVAAKYMHEVIMSPEEYASLKEVRSSNNIQSIIGMVSVNVYPYVRTLSHAGRLK